MSHLRMFNRYILTGLFFSALALSTSVSAKTFLVEFQAASSTGGAPFPFFAPPFNPGDVLFDFTFDAVDGAGGLNIDRPNELRVHTDNNSGGHPFDNSISSLNVYGWGNTGQHGDVSATSIVQGARKDFRDFPRDGTIDSGTTGQLARFTAPPIFAPPTVSFLPLIYLDILSLSPAAGGDRVSFFTAGTVRRFFGDFIISEVSVAAVPVPAAVWLFGTALIGLAGFSKRKSKVVV